MGDIPFQHRSIKIPTMICLNCSKTIFRSSQKSRQAYNGVLWVISRSYATGSKNPTISHEATPSASKAPSKDATTKTTKVASSLKAGQTIKGIQYLKNRPDPIALEDSAYPDWLWTVLETRKPQITMEAQMSSEDAANLYSKSKAKRKAAAKKLAARGEHEIIVDVPLDHQTVDMPYDDPITAAEARKATKKVQRARNRAGIKERNYLGGLR